MRSYYEQHKKGLITMRKSLLVKICKSYEEKYAMDPLKNVTKKVEEVKVVMQDNIDTALMNCVKLEKIQDDAENLQQNAGDLKNKMWWKNMKMKFIIGGIILVTMFETNKMQKRK